MSLLCELFDGRREDGDVKIKGGEAWDAINVKERKDIS